ncbi:hypothetical protein PInf_005904 [Phytophthora infestans]|nr:hypothetical protein PInf_005904 [Phytophthora infestans]
MVGSEDIIEGRGGGKLSDYFGKSGGMKKKMLHWARAGKADDFVIENLNLKGLSGHALKSNKNYKHFEQFQEALLDISLKKMTPTSDIWRRMGLEKLKTIDDVEAAQSTDAFLLYVRYARHFDAAALKNNIKHKTAIPVISDDVTFAEALARLTVWKMDDRPANYVKAALRLDNLSPTALLERQYFDLYVNFFKGKAIRMYRGGETKEDVDSFVKTALSLNSMPPENIPASIDRFYKFVLDPNALSLGPVATGWGSGWLRLTLCIGNGAGFREKQVVSHCIFKTWIFEIRS